jgi:hypothetical protein
MNAHWRVPILSVVDFLLLHNGTRVPHPCAFARVGLDAAASLDVLLCTYISVCLYDMYNVSRETLWNSWTDGTIVRFCGRATSQTREVAYPQDGRSGHTILLW